MVKMADTLSIEDLVMMQNEVHAAIHEKKGNRICPRCGEISYKFKCCN